MGLDGGNGGGGLAVGGRVGASKWGGLERPSVRLRLRFDSFGRGLVRDGVVAGVAPGAAGAKKSVELRRDENVRILNRRLQHRIFVHLGRVAKP